VVISLVGMRFHVRIGILSHERIHAQPLEIDVAVTRPDDAPLLDYRALYSMASGVVSAEPLDYLEQVAAAVVDGALALPAVTHVRVAVRKPHVTLDGPLAHAEVVMERTRE
jgi:dihydroneopterin aldolase